MTTTHFQYDPLPLNQNSIRILRLHPAIYGASGSIQCSLRTTSLEQANGTYDALSYAWGPEDDAKTIFIDGKRMKIRKNLHDFLSNLRSLHAEMDIWVDAICINQSSTNEKNHQVARMSKIYQSCRQTHAWLGSGNPEVDLMLRWARLNQRPDRPVQLDYFMRMRAILSFSYWKRLWVVQELILSREVVVHSGTDSVRWPAFVKMCTNIYDELPLGSIWRRRFDESTIKTVQEQRLHGVFSDLVELIWSYYTCECSDRRDRVFGLLGLLSGETNRVSRSRIPVDYSLSLLQLFQKVLQTHNVLTLSDWMRFFPSLITALAVDTAAIQHLPLKVFVEFYKSGSIQTLEPYHHLLTYTNISRQELQASDVVYEVYPDQPTALSQGICLLILRHEARGPNVSMSRFVDLALVFSETFPPSSILYHQLARLARVFGSFSEWRRIEDEFRNTVMVSLSLHALKELVEAARACRFIVPGLSRDTLSRARYPPHLVPPVTGVDPWDSEQEPRIIKRKGWSEGFLDMFGGSNSKGKGDDEPGGNAGTLIDNTTHSVVNCVLGTY